MRAYELWQLVEQAARLPGDILEVGVWRGGTGCIMAKRLQIVGSEAKVFMCDTFCGVVKAGEADTRYVGGEHADTSEEYVRNLAASFDVDNIEILTGIFPDDTAHQIEDRQFALCHIDVDVYESALHIFDWVWPRMPVGGIVVFDDYGFPACSGITQLVNEKRGMSGAVVMHNLNGHAVIVKTELPPQKTAFQRIFGR
ncbi:methyltransferase [Sphingomonas paeninsulae]|uniref:Methyltransferase n=2 Tax=Sphingomonas paeninsulae TaxID=2319844 RepID=A0A494TIG1_SPHPE|nr:methyltransferase [Sphingomonas paeninsulae]